MFNLSYILHISFFPSAKPRIQPGPSLLKALIGQTVALPCVVQGEPSPEVTWFHNGLPVGDKNTTPLRILRANHDDQGTYQCVARNTAGQETSEIKLEILGEYLQFSYLSQPDKLCRLKASENNRFTNLSNEHLYTGFPVSLKHSSISKDTGVFVFQPYNKKTASFCLCDTSIPDFPTCIFLLHYYLYFH